MSSTVMMVGAALAAVLAMPLPCRSQASGPDADLPTHFASRAKLIESARELSLDAGKRAVTDPERARNFSRAAHMFFYAGRVKQARGLLEQAADAALRRGQVELAADQLIKAALLAHQQRDGSRAARLVLQAEALASSPTLSRDQRVSILQRVRRSGEPDPR